jgi:hypothetical protein
MWPGWRTATRPGGGGLPRAAGEQAASSEVEDIAAGTFERHATSRTVLLTLRKGS